ncbi:MAG: GIY-YIG nuclease family protein [Hellea sp.]
MFFVYITANRKNGAIYTGQCDDLLKRIYEHKWKRYDGHTARYNIDRLMWFEIHETRDGAFKRERQIKEWKREWRLNLFLESNPHWDDLFHSLTEEALCDPARMYPDDFSQSEYQLGLANSR